MEEYNKFNKLTYPVETIPDDVPSLKIKVDVPLALTPLSINVMRLVPDGMLVKSKLVPLVVATAVPELMTPVVVRLEPSNTILTLSPSEHATLPLWYRRRLG